MKRSLVGPILGEASYHAIEDVADVSAGLLQLTDDYGASMSPTSTSGRAA